MDDKLIFISFSNKDSSIVTPIVETIEYYYGIKCWFQPNNSKRNFSENIAEGIENSKFFICFVSKNSIQSFRVQNEIECAIDKYEEDHSYCILPIEIESLTNIEKRKAKLFFGSLNWLYKKNYKDHHSLILTIFSQLGIQHDETHNLCSIYTGNEDIEVTRLNLQNEYLNKITEPYLDSIFSQYDNPSILDIGCSDGSNTKRRLLKREYKCLLGVDKNENKIRTAQNLNLSDKNSFLLCDIESPNLDFILAKYLKENTLEGFNIIHIASVLLHINKPDALLKKLYKYLSPEGTIFIQDEDDGYNISYPHNKLIESCNIIWKHSLESGDRTMGRKIPKLLTDCGFTNIHLLSSTISSLDFNGEFKEVLWDIYYNSDLWVTNSPAFFDNIDAYKALKRYQENHAKLKQQYLNGEFFVTLGYLFFSAKK